MNRKDWISCSERLPDNAGLAVLVSAVNKFGQRTEFIAFQGYGSSRWYTYDSTKIDYPKTSNNVVSSGWNITHWRPLPKYNCVDLVPESDRPKSEKFKCTGCGEFCYYPHSRNPIPYRFCPNCGKEVERHASN